MQDSWFFDRFAPVYDRAMPSADPGTLEAGLRQATGDVGRVLDVGGGTGRIARAVPGSRNVTVVDASAGMLAEARRHGTPGVRGDAAHLPFADASVDAVVAADFLHHVVPQAAVLRECARVVRPGGVVVVQEFDPGTLPGRVVALYERALGWPATFRTPPELAADLRAATLSPTVVDEGFEYTVAGVRPEPDT